MSDYKQIFSIWPTMNHLYYFHKVYTTCPILSFIFLYRSFIYPIYKLLILFNRICLFFLFHIDKFIQHDHNNSFSQNIISNNGRKKKYLLSNHVIHNAFLFILRRSKKERKKGKKKSERISRASSTSIQPNSSDSES